MSDIRTYAKRLASQCIEDWAHEGWFELNDQWGTEFSDEELAEIVRLAQNATIVITEDV